MRPTEAVGQEIHQRLLAQEEDAFLDLVDHYFERLLEAVRRRWSGLPDPTEVDTAVEDALLALRRRPEAYSPSGGTLWNFLFTAAHRDLQSLYKRDAGRPQMVFLEDSDVELREDDWNISVEIDVMRRLAPDGLPDGVDMVEVNKAVAQAFSREPDRSLLPLVLDDVRETEVYAEVMGIGHLPIQEQRYLVKKAKDRIRVMLKRLRSKLGE